MTGISGTADGFTITGLSSYAGADQLLYFPPVSGSYADFAGISFQAANGVDFNITSNPGPNTSGSNFISVSTLDPGGYGGSNIAVDMTVSATPLPATLPLFAGGLGFVGYLTRRRKQALAAA